MATFDRDHAAFLGNRVVPHSSEAVLDAFAQPERLARWWGPSGFTNTFEVFEFRPGGRWKLTMHGPRGTHHPNESEFLEITPSKVVIQHISNPRYVLTVTLTAQDDGTEITWRQVFESTTVAERISHIVEPATEQNLDRLAAELGGG